MCQGISSTMVSEMELEATSVRPASSRIRHLGPIPLEASMRAENATSSYNAAGPNPFRR